MLWNYCAEQYFRRGNKTWECGPGLMMEAPSLGLPSVLLLEIQPGAKGNGPGVPSLFYIPELQHRHGLRTPKLHNTEKRGQFGDIFSP